ncbi:hypothetical protein PVT67_13525 [Gallaecimonas kandeliae]|uniref:hypothetical protein n=1 Tax=Gallaecimonas kandeliae TaxID=3029055 RepID=UPI002648CD54|nr:hypothetical protein [Gallaecimonas kandeliae]WKE64680.1 hypothetical protein PVT67_13525 [Gallaecimonas kandeliae]
MKTLAVIPLVVLALAGCASNATDTVKHQRTNHKLGQSEKVKLVDEKGKEKGHLICSYTKPMGSNITKKVCRTREEIEQSEKDTERALHELSKSGNQTHS